MEPKFSSESASDWLRYINNANKPLGWLAPYEDTLFAILQKGLNREREFRKSFELLTLVFEYYALTLSHTERWSLLLQDALLMALDIKDNDLIVKVFRWMGEVYRRNGKPESASTTFLKALDRAESGAIDDMKVAVYIGLFKLRWFNVKEKLTQTLVKRALDTATRVQDPALQADLYDALAPEFARQMETDIALGYGQTAFMYWQSVKNHSAIGRTAYTLAAIYMHISQIKDDTRFLGQALLFLEIAREALAHTDDEWQYPLLSYAEATIYFQSEDFEAAASWYRESLGEAERMNSPQYLVIAQHGLGLAQARLGDFESARFYLDLALNHWDSFNNSYEKASVLVGMADLELRANNFASAMHYIDQGLEAIKDIEDPKRQQFIQVQFQAIISQLD